ncbi:helix-turn-helix domain-containing protein [Flavicella marina]|uniref:helix-turn-helix domain-containing protein n=1 Tax=Flavicella marina TaxID=1475951 RepID=UPI001264035E|nr:AraC family transcriptional regulator [Flavicella marina]
MNFDNSKFKNIDKSTIRLFREKGTFTLIHIKNVLDKTAHQQFELEDNYIQIYFSLQKKISVAFNMEHCAIHLSPEDSGLVYFKEDDTKVLTTLPANGELLGLLIPVPYFHSLFAHEGDSFFNFDSIKGGRPIIEEKVISSSLKFVLNQLVDKKLHGALQSIYMKGKIYELLSLYFNISEETESDHCPFMANEETVAQIKKAKDIIIENMANPPSLEELSKQVGLNIKKLKMGFKEFYGTPVYTFLLNYKLDFSKKLLEENKLNVSEIATQIGYSNSSHFIAAFKKRFDITPKQFTKQE